MTKYFGLALRLAVVVLGVASLTACSKANSSAKSAPKCSAGFPEAVDTAIQNTLAAHPDTAGAVVSIYHPAYGYMHKAYGLENRNQSKPMRTNHIFDIGSVMKNFRWVALHKLANAGLISLTDPVNNHVATPVLPGRTLKHLMQHSTGMIDIFDSNYMAHAMANFTHNYTYNEMVSFLNSSSGAGYTNGLKNTFNVGTDYLYSSFGPLIAGQIAENVTGTPIMQLIHEQILTPLGLNQTSFIWYEPEPANVAQGYEDAIIETHEMDNYADTRGFSSGFGGAMYSSACDLAHYTNNEFNNPSFLPSATVTNMTTDKVTPGIFEVGLGVFRYAGWGNFWGHLGASIHGHSSAIAHRTTDKLSIVVLTNIDSSHDNYQTHFGVISSIGAAL